MIVNCKSNHLCTPIHPGDLSVVNSDQFVISAEVVDNYYQLFTFISTHTQKNCIMKLNYFERIL